MSTCTGRRRRPCSPAPAAISVTAACGLAQWVLAGQPEWTRDRIVAAMHGTASQRVELARPIRVILFYLTAVVTPEDGAIHFAADLYGHDARLQQALARKTGS
jgi:murein L,D-transpeptidase YcbB/YkuD